MVDDEFWGLVGGFNGQCMQWSAFRLFGGQCFAFLLFGGQFLFLIMVGGRVIIYGWWLVAYGWWSVVDGWSWAVVLRYVIILCCHKELLWLWI